VSGQTTDGLPKSPAGTPGLLRAAARVLSPSRNGLRVDRASIFSRVVPPVPFLRARRGPGPRDPGCEPSCPPSRQPSRPASSPRRTARPVLAVSFVRCCFSRRVPPVLFPRNLRSRRGPGRLEIRMTRPRAGRPDWRPWTPWPLMYVGLSFIFRSSRGPPVPKCSAPRGDPGRGRRLSAGPDPGRRAKAQPAHPGSALAPRYRRRCRKGYILFLWTGR
jgi:hypothetical protein